MIDIRLVLCGSLLLILVGCGYLQKKVEISSPSFSNNSKLLIFSYSCNKDENRKLAEYNIMDGSVKKIVLSDGRNPIDPVYLGNGKSILFSDSKLGAYCADLCICDLLSEKEHCITDGGMGGWNPVFSGRTNKIYFRSMSLCDSPNKEQRERMKKLSPSFNIYSIDIDGDNRKKLTQIDDFLLYDLSIPLKGDFILMYRGFFKQKDSIWMYFYNNGNIEPFRPNLTPFMQSESQAIGDKAGVYKKLYFPRVSPDAGLIAFVWSGYYQGYSGSEIYVSNISSGATMKLTDLRSRITSLSFSPSGDYIAFVQEYKQDGEIKNSLWLADITGLNQKMLINEVDLCQ